MSVTELYQKKDCQAATCSDSSSENYLMNLYTMCDNTYLQNLYQKNRDTTLM